MMILLFGFGCTEQGGADTSAEPEPEAEDAAQVWEAEHGLAMVRVAAGSFLMGSPTDEVGRWIPEKYGGDGTDREVQHTVTFTHDLWVSSLEVTQGLFEQQLGYNPSTWASCGEACPVESITWHEAAHFANVSSAAAGLGACYTCTGGGADVRCEPAAELYACEGYRLPTEAEWEYFARAGQAAAFLGGGGVVPGTEESCSAELTQDNGARYSDEAWWCGNTTGTQPVGGRPENAWGLLDIEGNAHEWTNDWYDITWYLTAEANEPDPVGPVTGVEKVRRGGGWAYDPWRLRLAYRGWHAPDERSDRVGLRVVRVAR